MKNLAKYLVPMAVAAIALVSCNKEGDITSAPENTVRLTFVAQPEPLKGEEPELKSYIDANNTILWGTGEVMKGCITAGEKNSFATSDEVDASGQTSAAFSFTFTDPGDGPYLYQGLYPASAAVTSSNNNPANYKVNLPAIQNATASSYDPAAYIMVAKPESKTVLENWTASYRRGTALNKITLKNLPSGVSINRVKITAPAGKYLAGGRHIDLSTAVADAVLGDIYTGGGRTETIEVKYATALTGTNVDVWFTSWGVEISANETLTIVAYTTDSKSYTKTITPSGTTVIKFQEGYLNTLGAKMENIAPETVTELQEGNYLILAKDGEHYYAMKAETVSSDTRMASVDYSGSTSEYLGDADMIWSVSKSGNSFILENDGKYLGFTGSDNKAFWRAPGTDWTENEYLLDIAWDANNSCYHITLNSASTRKLERNAQNDWFAFYTSEQEGNIIFVPATVDNRTAVTLSFAEDAINKTTANYSEFTGQTATASPSVSGITYAIDGDNIGTITAATGAVVLNGNTGSATVTATFAGNATYRPASASYTITVASASGPVYTKVTALSDVTAGTYVIVNDGYYLPNAAATSAGPVKNNNTKVTVSGNNLSGVTDEMTWSFTGSASEMTIKSTIDGDYYLVVSGNSNSGLRVNTTSNHTWTISDYSGTSGAFSLKDNSQNRYCASYSSGSDWRSYTSYNAGNYGDGGRIYLYKLDDSNVTPTVATPTFSISGSNVSIACATDGATIYYTLDDSTPTTSSTAYLSPVSILGSQQKTIKAFATKSGYDDSAVASETYYAINVAASSNGTVAAVPFAAEGVEVSLAITPDSGYALDDLSVVDGSNNTVSVSNNKFTMPASPVTVSATFALIPVTTIADVLADGAGTYDLNNLLVYAVNGKNAIIGDATGKMLLYMTNSLNVGDNINIASAATTVYQTTTLEITGGTITTNSSGNTIDHGTATDLNNASVATSTQTAFSASGFHSAVYVSMTGAQSGQNITGANTKLHLNAANSATDGKTVMVTGYIYSWSSSYNNYNFQAVTIAEDNTTPTLSVAPASLSWSASEYGSSNAKNIEVTLNGAAAAGDYTISGSNSAWTVSKNGNTITVYPNAENTSTTDAKSITLTIAHSDDASVYQEVTCTQAKKAADGAPAAGTVLWTDSFGDWGGSSTTFTQLPELSDYTYTGRSGYTDNTDVTLTASNNQVRGASSSATNMTSGHLWFNKSQNASVTTSAIRLYGATSLVLTYDQATSGSSLTASYSVDGGTSWTDFSASGPAANISREFTVQSGTNTIILKFSHASSNAKNTRFDNPKLTVGN